MKIIEAYEKIQELRLEYLSSALLVYPTGSPEKVLFKKAVLSKNGKPEKDYACIRFMTLQEIHLEHSINGGYIYQPSGKLVLRELDIEVPYKEIKRWNPGTFEEIRKVNELRRKYQDKKRNTLLENLL